MRPQLETDRHPGQQGSHGNELELHPTIHGHWPLPDNATEFRPATSQPAASPVVLS
jgi:hypothetical protein